MANCTAMTARGLCDRPLDDDAYADHALEHLEEPQEDHAQPIGG